MQGFELSRFGGPEVMRLTALPEPQPDAARPVRVRLAWAGVNYVDTYQREGRYPGATLPWRLGLEAAGVVDAALPGSGFAPGDVEASWMHHRFGAMLPTDLLDVLEAEEKWLAAQDKRPARSRAELATLIDPSIYRDAVKLRNSR